MAEYKCDITDCPKEAYAAGLCETHYRRSLRLKKPGKQGPRLHLDSPIQRRGQNLVDMNTRVSEYAAGIIEEMASPTGESAYALAAKILEDAAMSWDQARKRRRGTHSSSVSR